MYLLGRKIENEEITRPNTFILYFTAYLYYIIFITQKLRATEKEKTLDLEAASKNT